MRSKSRRIAGRRRRVPGVLAAWLLAWVAAAAPAAGQVADHAACRAAIAAVEPGSGLPPGLLEAIALVESGRADGRGGVAPWPWAINAAGAGSFLASRAEAVAAVAGLRLRGVRSVDVGCMQVNLLHHPQAFASLEEAFDPLANVRYAAGFLAELHRRAGGDWAAAIGRYHSGTPHRAAAYRERVLAGLGPRAPGSDPAGRVPVGGVPVGGVPVHRPTAFTAPGRAAPAWWVLADPPPGRLPEVMVPGDGRGSSGQRMPVVHTPRGQN